MLRATLTTLSILLVNGCSTQTFTQDEHTSIDDNVYAGEVLRKQAIPVSPQDNETQDLINLLMLKANTGENAVGLAAPQLGINKAAFVYRVPDIVDGKPQFPDVWEVALNPSYKRNNSYGGRVLFCSAFLQQSGT